MQHPTNKRPSPPYLYPCLQQVTGPKSFRGAARRHRQPLNPSYNSRMSSCARTIDGTTSRHMASKPWPRGLPVKPSYAVRHQETPPNQEGEPTTSTSCDTHNSMHLDIPTGSDAWNYPSSIQEGDHTTFPSPISNQHPIQLQQTETTSPPTSPYFTGTTTTQQLEGHLAQLETSIATTINEQIARSSAANNREAILPTSVASPH